MPIVEIDGIGRVQLGDEFMSLSPEKQNATIQEIAAGSKSRQQSGSITIKPYTPDAVTPQTAFGSRFAGEPQPTSLNTKSLGDALPKVAESIARGAETSPTQNMDIAQGNLVSAASQRTTPNVDQYRGKLISNEALQGDDGSVYFKDPATGQVVQSDSSKHVALRDPADNTVKIFARDDATNEGPAVGVARVLAPGLGAGAVTARPAIAAAKVAAEAPETKALLDAGARGFEAAAGTGETVSKATMGGLAETLEKSLKGINSREYLAPKTYRAVQELSQETPGTVQDLRGVRQMLGEIAQSPDKFERRAASHVIGKIDELLTSEAPKAADILSEANPNYAAGMRAKQLDTAADVAGLRAGRAGYGGNSVNTMRQVLSPIVEKAIKGNAKGFSKDEIEAMRGIVVGTPATNALRTVGMFSPSKGIVSATLGIASAGVLPAIGASANKLAAILTSKQIDRLNELVRQRSPLYAKAVEAAAEKYATAAEQFSSDPSPSRFAATVSASRALSAGLQRDGISITSGDLLKRLQGPMAAAADDEQPKPERVGDQ